MLYKLRSYHSNGRVSQLFAGRVLFRELSETPSCTHSLVYTITQLVLDSIMNDKVHSKRHNPILYSHPAKKHSGGGGNIQAEVVRN